MCYVLTVEKIILNYFALNPDKTMISVELINRISSLTVGKCNNAIITRVSRDDLEYAACSPCLEINSGEAAVRLVQKDESYFFLKNIDIFNQGMPLYVFDRLKESCKECAQ